MFGRQDTKDSTPLTSRPIKGGWVVRQGRRAIAVLAANPVVDQLMMKHRRLVVELGVPHADAWLIGLIEGMLAQHIAGNAAQPVVYLHNSHGRLVPPDS